MVGVAEAEPLMLGNTLIPPNLPGYNHEYALTMAGDSTYKEALVSVIVPIFNLEDYIEETINSLQNQTYPTLEIIVIDDRSTDRSWTIVNNIAKNDPRIRALKNSRKKGVSGARNTGLLAAKGQWIAFLDGDDLLDGNSIAARVDAARMHPQVDFISGDYRRFSCNVSDALPPQSQIEPGWQSVLGVSKQTNGLVYIKDPLPLFIKQHLTTTHACLLSAELVRDVGLFDESLPRSEDVHYWLRAAANAAAYVFTSASISYYRRREGSLSTTDEAPDEHAIRAFRSLSKDPKFQQHRKLLSATIATHIHKNSYHYRKKGMRIKAARWALEGLIIDPLSFFAWKNIIGAVLGR